jgi:protein phosphatase
MNRAERQPSRYKPYLWVIGEGTESLPKDGLVMKRYQVIAPRIWLDTQPDQRPDMPDELPTAALPYMKLHSHRLHVPGIYAALEQAITPPILMLENAPIHPQSGNLFPDINEGSADAKPMRQLNWLWQMWELWPVLVEHGFAASLLSTNNVRVEGWRLRLLELLPDRQEPTLAALIRSWRAWLPHLHDSVSEPLANLLDPLEAGNHNAEVFGVQLNELLLQQAAGLTSKISLAGATAKGPTQPRNEDACFPSGVIEAGSDSGLRIGIVCDGVGGHDGGEIASQLALQSLQIQLQALVTETEQESQLLPPQVIAQQIEAVIRIVNELINFQNDNQSRAGRQRMGTTLVMAVTIAQRVKTEAGLQRVHEIYLAHVGDSRAYWITPDYCHLLTVDDDIAGREVLACRQALPMAKERSDADALTQAIGTRGGDHLHPHIQRLVLDETGILLLCSDGLSDNYRIEDAWANYIGLIVKDIVTLEAAVASWIELANQKNGHDNTAVVLMHHKVLSPAVPPEGYGEAPATPAADRVSTEEAVLYGESPSQTEVAPDEEGTGRDRKFPIWALVLTVIAVILGIAGIWIMTRTPAPPDDADNPPVESLP